MKNLSVVALLGYLILFSLKTYAQAPLQCGVDERHLPDSTVRLMGQLPRLMADQRARKAAGERRICRVAIEIDSDTYLEFEKDTNRIRSYVLNQLELVSKIYEREINTQLVVVYIHIWKDTDPDPYRGELNIGTLHSRFRTVWDTQFKQIASDKRLYLPTKAIYGAGGLGDLGGTYATAYIGTYVIAHELGHNFGSPHTQSCTWPGGPIDFCSTSEGTCYTQSLQDITGTVMSYCSKNSLTFHPLCQTLMTDHAVKNFAILTTPDKAPVLAPQLTLSGTPFLYWNGQPQAERYDIDVATNAGFTQKIISDTTLINGYDMSKLITGQTYYVRVRSTNKFGVSNWSDASQLQRAAPVGIAPPVLLSPSYDQRLIPYNNAVRQFSVQPVNGATGYEVQITSATDYLFRYPSAKATSPTASFTVTSYLTGTLLWRVRTVVNDKTSNWSSTGRFVVNSSSPLSLPFTTNEPAPLSFPFNLYAQTNLSVLQVVLSTDSSFTKPTYQQTFQNSNSYIGMLDKLLPNTEYYLKLEETNMNDPQYPTGILSRAILHFKTGSTALSQRWSFVNSGTNAQWPQGPSYDSPIVASGNYVWYNTLNGPVRIHQDSLTTRTFDRNTTNGKIGNLSSAMAPVMSGSRTVHQSISSRMALPYPIIRWEKFLDRLAT